MNLATNHTTTASAQSRHIAVYLRDAGADILDADLSGANLSEIKIDPTIISDAKKLEEVVYAKPALLNVSCTVSIVVDTPQFALVPDEVANDSEMLHAAVARLWPQAEPQRIIVDHTAAGVCVIHLPADNIDSYVARTFDHPEIVHRISLLINLCTRQSRPVKDVKMYVFFNDDNSLDIIAIGADSLLMANTFECQAQDDAFYFVIAAAKDCHFDQLDDEMVIAGSSCDNLGERLRQYFNSVTLLPTSTDNIPLPLQIYI